MDIRIREAIRYLGYGRHAIDEPTYALIETCLRELDELASTKFIYRIFERSYLDENLNIRSNNLAKNLRGCQEVVLMAITLGTEVDRLLQKYEKINMAKAVVFQACAAATLEQHCDKFVNELAEELKREGKYLRPRFSPGYGDFSILHQKQILDTLEATKKIGLTLTDSYMLVPTKSVTAVIGISDTDERCHKSGCEVCDKLDCTFRRS